MAAYPSQRRSLLSSSARIQAPWVKVKIGDYEFGVFSRKERNRQDGAGLYEAYGVRYPNYIKSLTITKINGQVNQYTLSIAYPVRPGDDPNFFEKVFSSAAGTRKITFSYGDAMTPAFSYKDEEAVITNVTTSFSFGSGGQMGSVIGYQVQAVSGAALGTAGCVNFIDDGEKKKPSDLIKAAFKNKAYGLQDTFTGMRVKDLDSLIDGGDAYVRLTSKTNISALDWITYLAGCMVPQGTPEGSTNKDIYVLSIKDEVGERGGPYFEVRRTSPDSERTDAYEVDIGFGTRDIVTNFQINDSENWAIYYERQGELEQDEYIERLNSDGEWEKVYAPAATSKNKLRRTDAQDSVWWTKATKYPISATLQIQGLLRPAELMTYLRLNVIFPGGAKHLSSGLYIVTKQTDQIDETGSRTQLSLTRVDGSGSPWA